MRPYKKFDRKAPRFRISKYRYNLINKDLHKRFVKSTGIKIKWKEFKDISKYISEEIVNLACTERNGVSLPGQMGNIWLGLYKVRAKLDKGFDPKDYHNVHLSLTTNGYQGKVMWEFRKVIYKVKNFRNYCFHAHRDFSVKASKCFIENPELYIRVNNGISGKEREKNKKLRYNEFNSSGNIKSDKDSK